ncbi:MAG: J domain-containing protein [Flavobacteriales bacterium]|nr:J domain-containing protein [Flavobacteriales bacterium]MCC6939358.1 J domain-containing protein [Flavobacteriales bacterium]
MAVDYYKLLGIERNATPEAIKSAYRKLARKLHPDLNPNDATAKKKFQEINEANEVLSDPDSRKKYDTYGENWKHAEEYEKARQAQGASSGHFASGSRGGGSEEDYSDLFGSMFGGRGGRQPKFRGQDYHAELQLPLLEAYHTHKQTLTVNGKQIRITVPAGVEEGQSIKIPRHGGPGANGGPHGDLYITFHVGEHPRFKRVGRDLYTTAEIDLYTAVLGGELMLETLDGAVKLAVKPETQNGTKARLRGKGFPVYKQEGAFGDLIVTFHVKLPTGLTEDQQALFEKLRDTKT